MARVPTEQGALFCKRFQVRGLFDRLVHLFKASSARRYDRGGWASLIFRVRHRGFEDIWPPLLLVLLVSAAWTPLVATGTVSDGVCDAIDTYQSAFSLLMTVLSLLLAAVATTIKYPHKLAFIIIHTDQYGVAAERASAEQHSRSKMQYRRVRAVTDRQKTDG